MFLVFAEHYDPEEDEDDGETVNICHNSILIDLTLLARADSLSQKRCSTPTAGRVSQEHTTFPFTGTGKWSSSLIK